MMNSSRRDIVTRSAHLGGGDLDARRERPRVRATAHAGLLAAATLLLSAGSPVMAQAENIRVAIADNIRSVVLRAQAGLLLEGEPGGGSTAWEITADTLDRDPLRIRSRGSYIGVEGSSYRGTIEIRKKTNGRILVVNDLDIEDYLRGVVAAEVPSDWHMDALKAQAVAARTYALFQKRASGPRPYHVLATVGGQVYRGVSGERPRAVKAVEMTRGEVVLLRGEPIQAYYHASCGGRTEDALQLWGIDASYLRGVDCDCQSISAYGQWEKRFSSSFVENILRREGYRMNLIHAVEGGPLLPGGRVISVLFRHSGGATAVPSETLRSALGYSQVPSIFFEPELVDGEVVFSGRGSGHGVGLCQWGALELALKGRDYRSIVAYYYPGTTIGRVEGLRKIRLTANTARL